MVKQESQCGLDNSNQPQKVVCMGERCLHHASKLNSKSGADLEGAGECLLQANMASIQAGGTLYLLTEESGALLIAYPDNKSLKSGKASETAVALHIS